MSTTLQNEAEQNWPEDEAHSAAEYALALFADEGRDYYHQWLIKERSAVIHNLFDDDAALMDRYTNRFNQLTAPTTNLYL
jgi:hypothetical protein